MFDDTNWEKIGHSTHNGDTYLVNLKAHSYWWPMVISPALQYSFLSDREIGKVIDGFIEQDQIKMSPYMALNPTLEATLLLFLLGSHS